MALRITEEKLRDLFTVARKLRAAALDEPDDEYAGLYERTAAALEKRGWELAVRPFEIMSEAPKSDPVWHRPVDLLC